MDHLIDTITPSKAALAIIAGGARYEFLYEMTWHVLCC